MNQIREEVFALSYTVKGFVYPVKDMNPSDREWFLKRVDKQLKEEAKAIKKAQSKRR